MSMYELILGGKVFINLFAHKLSDHKYLEISG